MRFDLYSTPSGHSKAVIMSQSNPIRGEESSKITSMLLSFYNVGNMNCVVLFCRDAAIAGVVLLRLLEYLYSKLSRYPSHRWRVHILWLD